jgi:xanthine dehydrogenase accessory factor
MSADAAAPRMLILGARDLSVAVAALARTAGYEVLLADPRVTFDPSDAYSAVARTLPGRPEAVLAGIALGPRDAVLVLTHDLELDVAALVPALAGGAGYVGALGSRRMTARRAERLRESGLGEAEIAAIRAPCGLDVGAVTPEETAISIVAEVLAARQGRTGGSLRDAGGSIRPHDA